MVDTLAATRALIAAQPSLQLAALCQALRHTTEEAHGALVAILARAKRELLAVCGLQLIERDRASRQITAFEAGIAEARDEADEAQAEIHKLHVQVGVLQAQLASAHMENNIHRQHVNCMMSFLHS